MTQFKEALLAELSEQVTDAPARPARRPARRLMAAATGAVAVIAAVTVGVMALPSQQEPAFALEKRADGTFLLSWRDFSPQHFEEANSAMREAGARGRIYQLGEYGSCPGHGRHELKTYSGPMPPLENAYVDGEWKFIVPRMPRDTTLLWLVNPPQRGSSARSVLAGTAVEGPVPPCVQQDR